MTSAKKIVAIVGTYRKGRVIDTAVSEVLRGAEDGGATTQTIYLIDKHIEFCTNCRTCTQQADVGRRGRCFSTTRWRRFFRQPTRRTVSCWRRRRTSTM